MFERRHLDGTSFFFFIGGICDGVQFKDEEVLRLSIKTLVQPGLKGLDSNVLTIIQFASPRNPAPFRDVHQSWECTLQRDKRWI
jgi:hypothetical protein